VTALLDFAHSHGVGLILIGRSQAGGWRSWLGLTTDLRLVRQAEDLDVQVVAFPEPRA
jgi:two-component system sensor histidine kinase KdpD